MRRFSSFVLAIVLSVLALGASSHAGAAPLSERARLKLFEEVWRLVDREYFDPAFGGNDWTAIGTRYRALLPVVHSDSELHDLLAKMVAELDDTHTYYSPPSPAGVGPKRTLGIEMDEVEGQLVVASVAEGSEAAAKGVRPGMVLRTLDGKDPWERARQLDAWIPTILGLSSQRILVSQRMKVLLDGPAGEVVALGFSDPAGQTLEVRLPRSHQPKPRLPVASRRLTPEIGYLRWSSFDPTLTERIRTELASLRETRGLVVDLRGNGGGDPQVAVDVLRCLSKEEVPYGRFEGRRPPPKIRARACPFVYSGAVVVLLDRVSGSSSEIFANRLQETGRGRLVGETTSGSVLYHHRLLERYGAELWVSRWGYESPGGKQLDKTGVTPELAVSRTIAGLWLRKDEGLEAALKALGSPAPEPTGAEN